MEQILEAQILLISVVTVAELYCRFLNWFLCQKKLQSKVVYIAEALAFLLSFYLSERAA